MSLIKSETYSSPVDKEYVFEPGESITAPELARLLPYLIAAWVKQNEYAVKAGKISSTDYDALSEDLQQYFRCIN